MVTKIEYPNPWPTKPRTISYDGQRYLIIGVRFFEAKRCSEYSPEGGTSSRTIGWSIRVSNVRFGSLESGWSSASKMWGRRMERGVALMSSGRSMSVMSARSNSPVRRPSIIRPWSPSIRRKSVLSSLANFAIISGNMNGPKVWKHPIRNTASDWLVARDVTGSMRVVRP